MKNYNYKKINTSISYTPEKLAEAISASTKTIYTLIKNDELKIIPGGKNPYLIRGGDAKSCFKKKNIRNKSPIKHPNEFYCIQKCHVNRIAIDGTIYVKDYFKYGTCPVCHLQMRKYH